MLPRVQHTKVAVNDRRCQTQLVVESLGLLVLGSRGTIVSEWECVAAHTHHADLPGAACVVVRVGGGGLVRGLSAHRVLEGVATEGHALARIVVLVAALLVHEQLVALTREVAGGLGGVRLGVGCRLRRCRRLSRMRLACLRLVCSCCRFLLCFLPWPTSIVMLASVGE